MDPRILDLGDAAITVEFGDRIDTALLARVAAFDRACRTAIADRRLEGVIETVPTFRSLTLIFDPLVTSRTHLLPVIENLFPGTAEAPATSGRTWRLPACYEGEHAPDLAETARRIGIPPEEVVALHCGTGYVVYMLGFLPGFPFMGDLPDILHLPRRAEPRVRVPAGSVAIATGLTAIYPWESPGGWHLLGNCPAPLFDATRDAPALLQAGDRVYFDPVNTVEHARLKNALAAGELNPQTWCEDEHVSDA